MYCMYRKGSSPGMRWRPRRRARAAALSIYSMPLLVFWPLLAPRRRDYFSTLSSAVVV